MRLKLESLLQRERLFVFVCLASVMTISWAYMLYMAWGMSEAGEHMTMGCLMNWAPRDIAHLFIMWTIMMTAMMFPSATPMILIFTSFNGRQRETERALMPVGLFVLGYFFVWTSYSVLAATAQWGLHATTLLSHNLIISSPALGGVLLVAAGIFQWTPFRDACMSKCRSPLGFLMAEWREGRLGALIMGLKHGLNCVGCCWLLMLLSFVLGVMNLLWMAGLTIFMLVEKAYPGSQWVSRTSGMILILWGVWVTAGALR